MDGWKGRNVSWQHFPIARVEGGRISILSSFLPYVAFPERLDIVVIIIIIGTKTRREAPITRPSCGGGDFVISVLSTNWMG